MSLTDQLRFGTEKHTKIRKMLTDLVLAFKTSSSSLHENWRKDEELFYGYIDTPRDESNSRPGKDDNNRPEYKTLRIPYSYAAAMTAHTYISSVFLSRSPVFQVEGRNAAAQDSELAVESYLDYQLHAGRMKMQLHNWLMDPFRYGPGIVGCYWEKEQTHVGEIVDTKDVLSELMPGLFPSKKIYVEKPVTTYLGNKVYCVRPFDFIWDTRYSIAEFQKGEFSGEISEISLNALRRGAKAGTHISHNVKLFEEIAVHYEEYYSEHGADHAAMEPEDRRWFHQLLSDWKNKKKNAHCISVVDLYVKLVPKDWGLGSGENECIWYFCLAEDRIILAARPVPNTYSRFPYAILSNDIDLYKLAPRSMMRTVEPMEDVLNWLINQHFYNVRKHLNNNAIIDPSMIVVKDLFTKQPGGYIRKRPIAFGKDPAFAYQQIPSTDITRAHLSDVRMMEEFAQRILGVNDNIMGLVNPGGRKTAQEVRVSSSFATNRLKTLAEWFSASGFSELTKMLILNSQQYMDETLLLRVAGDLKREKAISIDSSVLGGLYDFAPVDGTLPVDRFAVANLMRDLVAQVAANPALSQQYDLLSMFEYVALLSGARNISRFRVQVVPDEMAGQMANNPGMTPTAASSIMPGPSQIPGMGPATPIPAG